MKTKQQNFENTGVKTMCTSSGLSRKHFKEFYSFLNIIKPNFENFFCIDGLFRARNNDRNSIIETRFTYFKNMDISIANIGVFVSCLSTLDRSAEIVVSIFDNYYVFTDGYQSVHFPKTDMEFMDNSFICEEERNEMVFENIDVDKHLLNETIPKFVVSNINKLTPNKYIYEIFVEHKKDELNKGYLVVYLEPKYGINFEPKYIVKFKEEFLIPMQKNFYFGLLNSPFRFKSEMTFNYYLNKSGDVIVAIYNTTVDGLFINIYVRSSFIEDEEIDF